MSTYNIEMNLLNSSSSYDILYPQANFSNMTGSLTSSQIPNLSASKITSGTLPASRGGTGVNSINALKTSLGISDLVKYEWGTRTGTGTNTFTISLSTSFVNILRLVYKEANTPGTISTVIPNQKLGQSSLTYRMPNIEDTKTYSDYDLPLMASSFPTLNASNWDESMLMSEFFTNPDNTTPINRFRVYNNKIYATGATTTMGVNAIGNISGTIYKYYVIGYQ